MGHFAIHTFTIVLAAAILIAALAAGQNLISRKTDPQARGAAILGAVAMAIIAVALDWLAFYLLW